MEIQFALPTLDFVTFSVSEWCIGLPYLAILPCCTFSCWCRFLADLVGWARRLEGSSKRAKIFMSRSSVHWYSQVIQRWHSSWWGISP